MKNVSIFFSTTICLMGFSCADYQDPTLPNSISTSTITSTITSTEITTITSTEITTITSTETTTETTTNTDTDTDTDTTSTEITTITSTETTTETTTNTDTDTDTDTSTRETDYSKYTLITNYGSGCTGNNGGDYTSDYYIDLISNPQEYYSGEDVVLLVNIYNEPCLHISADERFVNTSNLEASGYIIIGQRTVFENITILEYQSTLIEDCSICKII